MIRQPTAHILIDCHHCMVLYVDNYLIHSQQTAIPELLMQ